MYTETMLETWKQLVQKLDAATVAEKETFGISIFRVTGPQMQLESKF